MYHQQQLQSHSHNLPSRAAIPPEKHFLHQGGGDSGLILSTDAKPRLKWTPELHERFVEAVNQLGGPDKATPKTIMRLMGIPELTLYHLKSHLQKYRLSKNLHAQANAVHAKNVLGFKTATDKPCEGNGSPATQLNIEPQINKSMHLSEALQMQIEVQRRLHEQLEVQRHLQLRIEAQGRYLQSVLEKAREALANQQAIDLDGGGGGVAGAGLEADEAATATQLLSSDLLVSRASSAKRVQHQHRQLQLAAGGDGSVDSCLTTACEGGGGGSRRDHHDMLSIGLATPRGATTSCEEYLFLDEPPPSRRAAASGDDDEEHDELDLNMHETTDTARPRGCDKIDLNGSSWN
ncbi:hypothetical protein ACP4OV_007420 [Aristida adscensionis]